MKLRVKKYITAALLAMLATSANAQEPGQEALPPADGYLFRTMITDTLEKEYGIRIGGWMQLGLVWNDVFLNGNQGSLAQTAPTNSPLVLNRDTGFQLNQLNLLIEKGLKTNVLPRITPTPGPVPQAASWGFYANLFYGRDGQPLQTYGWDNTWHVNSPGNANPAVAARDRQNFLIQPQLWAQAYFPIGLGMAAMFGNFQTPIGYEIGYAENPAPQFFYSHSYAFAALPIKHTGLYTSWNLMRSESNGLLTGEIGVVQGWSNFQDNNDQKTVLGALRWRSPNMATWMDFEFITGDEQNEPGGPVQAPTSLIISPTGQNKTSLSLNGNHDFDGAPWRVQGELMWGQQKGNGAPDTISILTGPGFSGASWYGAQATGIYKLTKALNLALRYEFFADRDGFALFPNTTGQRSNFNEVTFGARYWLNRFFMFRPEIRYDWQSNRQRGSLDNAFCGGGTNTCKDNQFTISMDMVVYF